MVTVPAPMELSNISTRPFCEQTFRSFRVSSHFARTSETSSFLKGLSAFTGISTSTFAS